MRGFVITAVVCVLLAGCNSPPKHSNPPASSATTTEPPASQVHLLGRDSVQWAGTGTTTFSIQVPNATDELFWAVWGSAAHTDLGMTFNLTSCPDAAAGGGTGFSVGGGSGSGGSWCHQPPAGRAQVRVTMAQGIFVGDLCVYDQEPADLTSC